MSKRFFAVQIEGVGFARGTFQGGMDAEWDKTCLDVVVRGAIEKCHSQLAVMLEEVFVLVDSLEFVKPEKK
jgi:hypothetical protein